MRYAILINTCDRYEDCWEPFFSLLSKFWPDCSGDIYLNTEYKSYHHPGLTINAVKGCVKNNYPASRRAKWSLTLKWALESIDSDIILYMQEDYFLKGPVNNSIIENFISIMDSNPEIKCIHLTDQAVLVDSSSEYINLFNVTRWQRFRASCQAALWKKQELFEILRTYEDAWDFEEFASLRSSLLGHRYLAVDPSWVRLNQYEIIPYIFTGIIQGKWYNECLPLFKANNIQVDFSKRGIVSGYTAKTPYENLKFQCRRKYLKLRNKIEMYKIKKTKA